MAARTITNDGNPREWRVWLNREAPGRWGVVKKKLDLESLNRRLRSIEISTDRDRKKITSHTCTATLRQPVPVPTSRH